MAPMIVVFPVVTTKGTVGAGTRHTFDMLSRLA